MTGTWLGIAAALCGGVVAGVFGAWLWLAWYLSRPAKCARCGRKAQRCRCVARRGAAGRRTRAD